MKHVFYHDDVDGVASAAIYLSNVEDEQVQLHPVSSFDRGLSFSNMINSIVKPDDRLVIIDYEYNSRCDEFYDHHRMNGSDQIDYLKRLKNGSLISAVDSDIKSCARILEAFFKSDDVSVATRTHEIAEIGHKYDACEFDNIAALFYDTDIGNCIYAAIETARSRLDACDAIIMSLTHYIKTGVSIYPRLVNQSTVNKMRADALSIGDDMTIYGDIAVTMIENAYQAVPRFSEHMYLVQNKMDTKYILRVSNLPGPKNRNMCKIQLRFNSWNGKYTQNPIDLGTLFNQVHKAAGGHKNAAAAVVQRKEVRRINDALISMLSGYDDDKINSILNKDGGGMEKYGVDHEADSFEKNASDLSAEEKVDMGEARKRLAEKFKPNPTNIKL